MAKPTITILGLGTTGTSVGLALQRANAEAELVGHDKVPEAAQAARKLNAVPRVEWNLHAACELASLIILAMPLSEVDETLVHIREDVQPNTLVFVISEVLQPAAELLALRLGDHGHAVVGHAILNGVGGSLTPRVDLFDKAVFVVAAGANTDPSALELASNFVESVGAQPLFMDALEHDGIVAGVEQLPQLLGVALVHMLAGSPGWGEARRLAGRAFAQSTDTGRSAAHLFTALKANRANLLSRIAQLERELAAWKQWLAAEPAAGDDHPLQLALTDAVNERAVWEMQAELKNWDPSPQVGGDAQSHGFLRQMFLGNLGNKKSDQGGKR